MKNKIIIESETTYGPRGKHEIIPIMFLGILFSFPI